MGLIVPMEYPHQIAFNVLPHVESFEDNGYTTEEMKMVNETRKILHDPRPSDIGHVRSRAGNGGP